MKQLYLLLLILSFSTFSYAQTEGASQLYGYKQAVSPGTIRVDDNGAPIPRKKQFNYFIYLASATKVTPVEIWINGEAFSVNATEIRKTPVEYKNPTSPDNKEKVLVPKTTRKVLQLSSSGKVIENPTQKGKLLSSKNELVIIYKGNGKLYYKTLSKLSELDRIVMQ